MKYLIFILLIPAVAFSQSERTYRESNELLSKKLFSLYSERSALVAELTRMQANVIECEVCEVVAPVECIDRDEGLRVRADKLEEDNEFLRAKVAYLESKS